jgi:hypothetical protein
MDSQLAMPLIERLMVKDFADEGTTRACLSPFNATKHALAAARCLLE